MYSFTQYLAAKKTVDDRALNRSVFSKLKNAAAKQVNLRCLELGAGVGTMLERLLQAGVFQQASYMGIDSDPANIETGLKRLQAWGTAHGYQVQPERTELVFRSQPRREIRAALQSADALEYCTRSETQGAYDLLAAHAFLDLFDLPGALPVFLRALRPGGLCYFTINFDGDTIFEPTISPVFDDLVTSLYHRTMDERLTDGKRSGDSRSGRHLFSLLPQNGVQILAAGASDWVVFPGARGYPNDEAYFLHHILHFFEQSLGGHPELDQDTFRSWLTLRHAQVERGELVFIAHQLDFLGIKNT